MQKRVTHFSQEVQQLKNFATTLEATQEPNMNYMYLPPLLMPERYSGAALYEAAGRRPAVAWLSALPVMSNISPGANPPSARYQRPLGSQT